MNEIDEAATLFAQDAVPWLVEKANRQVNLGALRWRLDPEVPKVVGLVVVDEPNRAVVVVYLQEKDFEIDTEWADG